jgi:hypothetical protein
VDQEFTMNLKRIAATATMAGALGFAAVGLGAGLAQADDDWWWDPVPPPGVVGDVVGVPPGQIAHIPFVPPPGHWDKPWKWFP